MDVVQGIEMMIALRAMVIGGVASLLIMGGGGESFAQPEAANSDAHKTRGSGVPANLCRELLAFVHRPVAAVKAADAPVQLATAVSAKKSDDTSAKPSASGTPQNTSGQSGQITSSGPGAAGPQGDAQNKAAPVGATATAKDVAVAPSAAPPMPTPSAENVEQVERDAGSNNLRGCKATAQSMRRSGVAMPGPLLALAAMSATLLEAAPRP